MKSSLVLLSLLCAGECFCAAFVIPSNLNNPLPTTKSKRKNHNNNHPHLLVLSTTASSSSSSSSTSGTSSSSEDPVSSSLSSLLPYNWKEQWYALTYANYIPNPSESAEVVPAAVFGNPLVLWRSADGGKIHCADDVCPHRAAALSEGRIRDGKLECYYHGWQFDGNNTEKGGGGDCTFIPQLATNAQIPKKACLTMRECRVVEGIVWVWMGESSSTKDPPMQGDGLDPITGQRDGFIMNDFQIDLPYDHSYLVENLIDPAHIPISHDRTPGGGKREKAEAYDMIVDTESITSTGFTGRYRLESQQLKDDPYIEVQYEAPGIIRQQGFPRGLNSTIQFGAALHCMPLGLGRSRLLFRAYFGGLPSFLQFVLGAKPEFLRHLNSCKILEQDAGLITTQEDHFKRNAGRKLQDDFLLLQSSDLFVKTYRQWLDKVGHGMPWFQGLATASRNVDNHLTGFEASPALDPLSHRAGNLLETRYHRHVMHCPTTRNALAKVQRLKKIALGVAIVAITMSCGLTATATPTVSNKIVPRALKVLVPFIPISSIAAAALHRLEQAFFVSFKRKEQMRTEKGI